MAPVQALGGPSQAGTWPGSPFKLYPHLAQSGVPTQPLFGAGRNPQANCLKQSCSGENRDGVPLKNCEKCFSPCLSFSESKTEVQKKKGPALGVGDRGIPIKLVAESILDPNGGTSSVQDRVSGFSSSQRGGLTPGPLFGLNQEPRKRAETQPGPRSLSTSTGGHKELLGVSGFLGSCSLTPSVTSIT